MQPFSRRFYRPLGLARDAAGILHRRRQIRDLMRGEQVDYPFRERLMLAVTSVNDCRYCAYYHAREALAAGLAPEEIAGLDDGILENSPVEERPALLYAQHWAESAGRPDPAARARLVVHYGAAKTEQIELALRLIQAGNLLGNTVDAVLYYVSLGRLGGEEKHRPVHPPTAP